MSIDLWSCFYLIIKNLILINERKYQDRDLLHRLRMFSVFRQSTSNYKHVYHNLQFVLAAKVLL